MDSDPAASLCFTSMTQNQPISLRKQELDCAALTVAICDKMLFSSAAPTATLLDSRQKTRRRENVFIRQLRLLECLRVIPRQPRSPEHGKRAREPCREVSFSQGLLQSHLPPKINRQPHWPRRTVGSLQRSAPGSRWKHFAFCIAFCRLDFICASLQCSVAK